MMSDEQLERLVELLSDPEKAAACLPQEERERYEAAQQSVVRARHEALREGREVWIG